MPPTIKQLFKTDNIRSGTILSKYFQPDSIISTKDLVLITPEGTLEDVTISTGKQWGITLTATNFTTYYGDRKLCYDDYFITKENIITFREDLGGVYSRLLAESIAAAAKYSQLAVKHNKRYESLLHLESKYPEVLV